STSGRPKNARNSCGVVSISSLIFTALAALVRMAPSGLAVAERGLRGRLAGGASSDHRNVMRQAGCLPVFHVTFRRGRTQARQQGGSKRREWLVVGPSGAR